MRVLISLYLLFKSATRQKLTRLDVGLAQAVYQTTPAEKRPTWLAMIAWMSGENQLPEAFIDWRWGIEGSIRDFVRRLRGKQ